MGPARCPPAAPLHSPGPEEGVHLSNEVASPLLARPRSTRRAAIVLTVVAIAIWLAVAAAVPTGWVQAIDDGWHEYMADLESDRAVHVAGALSILGSTWVTVPLALLVVLVLSLRRSWIRLRVWAAALLPAYAVTLSGKALYARPRPEDRLLEVPTASFPSAHATDATVLALTLVLLFVPPGRRRWPWLLLAVAYALTMAWSRTYLRVHWLSDVSAGACWGAACALWSALVVGGTRPAAGSVSDV